jgi:hypothetical protein
MSVKTCPDGMIISEFDYETLRLKNLGKIREYYNTVLSDYTDKYYTYANKKLAEDEDEQDNAVYLLKEKGDITNLNDHLIEIKQNLNQVILDDFTNIKKQINEVKSLEGDLEADKVRIKELNEALSVQNIQFSAYNENLEGTTEMRNTYQFNHKLYIASTIILSVVVCIMIYILMNNNTPVSGNNNRNNLRNILQLTNPVSSNNNRNNISNNNLLNILQSNNSNSNSNKSRNVRNNKTVLSNNLTNSVVNK